MHNLAVHKFAKKKMQDVAKLLLIVILYLPYNILNAARFELIVVVSMGIVVWYTYYKRCSIIIGRKNRNMRKAIKKIVVVIVLVFVGFSIIAPFVGRTESNNIISQSVDYFGRSIQAFDTFVVNPEFKKDFIDKEAIYNLIKFLNQMRIIDGDVGKIHLEFAYQNGYSLGNTFTAFRRYYADLGGFGVIVFAVIGGYFFTKMHKKLRFVVIGKIDYRMICYGAIIFSLFLYCFDDYLFAAILSFNYLITFLCLYIVAKWFNGERIFHTSLYRKP